MAENKWIDSCMSQPDTYPANPFKVGDTVDWKAPEGPIADIDTKTIARWVERCGPGPYAVVKIREAQMGCSVTEPPYVHIRIKDGSLDSFA